MNLTMLPIIPLPTRGDPRPGHESRTGCSPPKGWDQPIALATSWRVKADVTIPALTTAGPYPSEILLGMNTVDNPKGGKTVEVKVKEGMLAPVIGSDPPCHWLLCVTPARDRHEQNLEALRDARGMVFFRAIKEIRRGEELLVWYSAELAMECGIPILTPGNIRSDQEYACTACDATFRYPNTLKAHIRFHCARNPMMSWLGQYSSLQPSAGSLLSAYQQELSKYFSHLGTLWNLRKMATVDQTVPVLPSASPPTATAHETKSAFRPCSSAHTSLRGVSPAYSPTQSHPSPITKLPEKSGASRHPHMDGHKRPRGDEGSARCPEGSKSALSNFAGSMPGIPSYLDKVYMYNYANYLRSDMSRFPAETSRPLHRMPFNVGMEYPPTSSHENILRSRGIPTAGLKFPESLVQRDENHSPNSERDSPPKIQMPSINFPLPSESAGEPIDLLPKSLYMSKAYKGHLCIYCGKLYSRKYGLKIHLRTHTGYKPLKCKVCLRPFGDPSNLNKHIRLHAEGDTPYRCEYCGKVLVRRRDLERHIKSRHPNHDIASLSLIANAEDDKSDKLCETDTSFIDVDDDLDDDDADDMDTPLDMSRQDIEVT